MVQRPRTVLAHDLADLPLSDSEIIGGASDTRVTGVTLDSRAVHPGDLYAALPGAKTHGARFARQAIDAGAAAVLTDPEGVRLIGQAPVPLVVVADPRDQLGEVAAAVYGHPARSLTVIGVTGTNGKTTMTYLLAAALRELGATTGVIGTIGIQVGETEIPSGRTTPEAPDVQALLAVMVEGGVQAVAVEVSSHALALGRVDGLVFDVAVFTNLTQDHLDFHASMQEYFEVKAQLFSPQRSLRAVVCVDDQWGRALAGATVLPCVTYGLAAGADWTLADVAQAPNGSWSGKALGPDTTEVAVTNRLPGQFNRSNTLGSLVALIAAGYGAEDAARGLATCRGVPGRMEPVGSGDVGAFVDYAHTPDAVQRVVAAARGFSTGRVLVALGCGGDRDRGKRPLMAAAAAQADLLLITDDNPRSEDPAVIRTAMRRGVPADSQAEVLEIGDRAQAIREIVARAESGDVVLVLGKGHETGQEVAGVVTPFDDRVVLAEALAARKPGHQGSGTTGSVG